MSSDLAPSQSASPTTSAELAPNSNVDRALVLLAVLAPLLGFIFLYPQLKLLFWFGDELHLLSEIRHEGYWKWVTSNFAENFVPLFKLLWGGGVFVFGGSYFAMVLTVWITHAVNAALIASLLHQMRVPALGIAFGVITFSLSHSTHESLGWTVQWSAVLANTFLLAALNILASAMRSTITPTRAALCIVSVVASSMCFSRGILVCATVSFAALVWALTLYKARDVKGGFSYLLVGCGALVPAVLSSIMIFKGSTGNHQSFLSFEPEVMRKMYYFALHAFAMNPLSRLFGDDNVSWNELYVCLAIKAVVVVWAFAVVRRYGAVACTILITFFAFELGSSILLGIGRYHTELRFAIGSRYQYEYLISLAPFIAVALGSIRDFSSGQKHQDTVLPILRLGFVAWLCILAWQWPATIEHWSGWHGTEGRRALLEMSAPPPGMTGTQLWLGIPPIISYEEAKAVTREFRLH